MGDFFTDYILNHLMAMALGLFAGWLLWRWRRRSVDGTNYDRLLKAESGYQSEIATLTGARSSLEGDLNARDLRVTELEHEVGQLSELRVTSDALRVDYHEAVEARSRIEANLQTTERARAQLATNLAEAEQSRAELQSLFEQSEQARGGLQTNFQQSEQARGELQTKFEQSEAALDELQVRFEASEQARAELKAKVEESERARAALQTDLDAAEGDRVRLVGELSAAEEAHLSLKSDFDQNVSRLASLESPDGEMSVLQATLATATAGLAAKELLQGDLEGKVESLESDLGLTRSKIADLEGQLADGDAQRTQLEGAKAEADDLTGVLRGQLGSANERITELESAAELAAVDSSSRVEVLEGQLGSANGRIAELESAAELAAVDSSSRVEVLEGQLGSANGRIAELESANVEIAGLRSNLDEAGKAQTVAAAAATAAAAAAATHAADLDGKLNAANGRIAELEKANGEIAGLRSSLDEAGKAQSAADAVAADLEAKLTVAGDAEAKFAAQAEDLRGQLGSANGRIAELEKANGEIAGLRSSLDEAGKAQSAADANVADLTAKLAAVAAAAANVSDLESQLGAATGRITELERANGEIAGLRNNLDAAVKARSTAEASAADLTSQLAEAREAAARVADLEARLVNAEEGITRSEQALAQSQSTIGGLNDDLGRRLAQIKELEAQLAQAKKAPKLAPAPAPVAKAAPKPAAKAEPATSLTSLNAGGWQKGTTKLGMPGASHTDDLKVVNGIGPKMEELLNGYGIKSWEQLAAFTKKDVATVDAALEDFPGRIERDEWVQQAREIIKNGHQPLQAAAKPRAAAPSTAPVTTLASLNAGGWQKGTTKLGTPGSAHKDDLKEINGIGPKMEELLNSYGIKSWEQLAAFTKKDVATVDAALEDFPGRIERDEWVQQARDFIKNGHEPTERAPKPRPAPSWQKGKTKLGTPGAGHADDLKVVNGIGPKMEAVLNDFGITSWEQLGAFTKDDVAKVTEAIDTFPGRIDRDEWVKQAKDLVKRFPLSKPYNRPTRETYLNNSDDENPWE